MRSAVFVTGGAGFIGSQVTDVLIRRGHDVTVLDDFSGGFVENVSPKAYYFICLEEKRDSPAMQTFIAWLQQQTAGERQAP